MKPFLLQEIVDNLINTKESLSEALIKLNYFGRLTKNTELINYTNNELNGYRDKDLIPNYRKTIATLYIYMQNRSNTQREILPISMLKEPYRSSLQYFSVTDGISVIEKMAREAEQKNSENEITKILPLELLPILQEPAKKLYKSNVHFDVVKARINGNPNIFFQIPNAVRTKLIDLVTSIGETFGYNIEIESFNNKRDTNNQIIINQMNTIINNSGDGNTINTGNENSIANNVNMHKGNFERLQSELQKQGIDNLDIQELNEIIDNETPNNEEQRLGENANGWISKIINKSLNGVGKIATGVSANLLASLIKQFYGMP